MREERRHGDEHLEHLNRRFKNDFGDSRRRSRNTSRTFYTDEDPHAIKDQAMDVTMVQIPDSASVGYSDPFDHTSHPISPVSIKFWRSFAFDKI